MCPTIAAWVLAFPLTPLVWAQAQVHASEPQEHAGDQASVDVLVSGDRAAAPNLTAADFSISQDGAVQKIDSVSHPKNSAKHVVLYLDTGAMNADDRSASASAANHLVEKIASASGYVAVAAMRTAGALMVQEFTNSVEVSRAAITTAIESADLPLNQLRIGPMRYALSDSFAEICRSLGDLPGRKLIILFGTYYSEGGAIKACNRADVAIYCMVGWFSPLPVVRPSPPKSEVADETGGEAFWVNPDLNKALDAVIASYVDSYRVFFTPPPATAGSCHALQVSVNVRGLAARARNEYCTGR